MHLHILYYQLKPDKWNSRNKNQTMLALAPVVILEVAWRLEKAVRENEWNTTFQTGHVCFHLFVV